MLKRLFGSNGRNLTLVAGGLGMIIGTSAQAVDRATIHGTVMLEDIPVCAQVLINGQSMFSCKPYGEYSLNVPLDAKGKATVFSFASGMFPYRAEVTPAGNGDDMRYDIAMVLSEQPETSLISRSSNNGAQGNGASFSPSFSENGVYVVYESRAKNLVAEDQNNGVGVFLYNRNTGVTQRVVLDINGQEAKHVPGSLDLSDDGLYMAFTSFADSNVSDGFVRNLVEGTTTRVNVSTNGSIGNGSAGEPSISGDGRYVAFSSSSSNLVPVDTNGTTDVFLRDLDKNKTTLISVSAYGEQFISFSEQPFISADGKCVAFTLDTSEYQDYYNVGTRNVYVHTPSSGETRLVSANNKGLGSVIDLGNENSVNPKVSADCRYIAFDSWATDLVDHDTNGVQDVFVRDLEKETTVRVSIDSDGNQANSYSSVASISSDGRYVLFFTYADNLVYGEGDINGLGDMFTHDLETGETKLVNVSTEGLQANQSSRYYGYSGDLAEAGKSVVFSSAATSLVRDDENKRDDIFVRTPLYQLGNR